VAREGEEVKRDFMLFEVDGVGGGGNLVLVAARHASLGKRNLVRRERDLYIRLYGDYAPRKVNSSSHPLSRHQITRARNRTEEPLHTRLPAAQHTIKIYLCSTEESLVARALLFLFPVVTTLKYRKGGWLLGEGRK
jgi:hypothetical protein